MVSTNRFQGLHRGPIDHRASSVINAISLGAIDMGSSVELFFSVTQRETLPRVGTATVQGVHLYGIVVGGDADGIYGDGSAAVDDKTRATTAAGQGLVVVTQGRCLARVSGVNNVAIGDKLAQSGGNAGVLKKAVLGDSIIATALNIVAPADTDMIAVDVKREGKQTL